MMNSKKILIIDTSILCCWINVPTKNTAGSDENKWTHERVISTLEEEKESTLVLPIASLIETGNHISQASDIYRCAKDLTDKLESAINGTSPWAVFASQSDLWEKEKLLTLAKTWPDLATTGISIGDAMIKDVAEHYASAGYEVEILTADQGLKAYEPIRSPIPPRRRS